MAEAVVKQWEEHLPKLDAAASRKGASYVSTVAVWLQKVGIEEPDDLIGINIEALVKDGISEVQLGVVRRVQKVLTEQKQPQQHAPMTATQLADALGALTKTPEKDAKKNAITDMSQRVKLVTFEGLSHEFLPRGAAVEELANAASKLKDTSLASV